MSLYGFFLGLHNITRWAVLVFAALALFRAFQGLLKKGEWSEADRKAGLFYGISMDVQMLIGLILYLFLSEFGLKNFMDPNRGMDFILSAGQDYRFFAMEHLGGMLVATVLVHIGSARAKKAANSAGKFRQAAIFYAIATLLIVFSIPWWRPFFPGL